MDKKLLALLSVFFLGFLTFVSVVSFNKSLVRFTRAKNELMPSAQKSIIIAWPLQLKADGMSVSKITVFVRDIKGGPVKGKNVSLRTAVGKIKVIQEITDKEGKAKFELSSSTPGKAEISAFIGKSIKVTQPLSILFK